MELDKILENRRSIRKFVAGSRLTKEMISEFIAAALDAPSWKNTETARYHVVMSPEKIASVRNCFNAWNVNNTENVQALVVTAFEKNLSGYEKDGTPSNELGNGWGIYDAGLQNSIFLLKAAEAGIDSLVMGIRDAEAIRAILGIPESQEILSVIALGEKDSAAERPARKKVEDIVKFY